MAKQIVVNLNMFTEEQTIFLFDGEEEKTKIIAKVPLNQLYSFLPMMCCAHESNKIHLFGNEMIIDNIIKSINETGNYMYKNIFEIEVN